MHIELLQEHLLSTLQLLQKAVPSKPQLPILSSLLLHAEQNNIEISATDLFFGIKTSVVGKVITEGKIAIPGKIFKDYISSLSPGKITLELANTSLTITSGNNVTTIQCVAPEEFPDFPTLDGNAFSLPFTTLSEIEKLTGFSASLDPTRPVLTTLLFHPQDQQLEVVSTDGFRLSTYQVPKQTVSITTQLLFPAKAMNELVRISTQLQAKEIECIVDEKIKQALFKVENAQIFVRLIEGEYPPYQKIIPADFSTQILIDGEELEEHLKRAVIFSRDAANIVKFSIENDQLIISSTSPAFGTHQGTIHISLKKGTQGTIAFNARYVLDFLAAVKPEKVEFSMNESLTPAQFRPDDKQEYRYIVMPFRVNE